MADQTFGLPVRTEADLDQRVQVRIIDGINVSQMATVDTDLNLHIEAHGNDPGATDRVLRTSEQGHINISGIYDVSTNTDPANVGIISHVRNATLADAQQTLRTTGASPASDNLNPANISAIDVNAFMLAYDVAGGNWDRISITGGSLNVNVTNTSTSPLNAILNGIYDVTTNPVPSNIGLVAFARNASPGLTNQTNPLTSVINSTVTALDISLHDAAGAAYSTSNPLPVSIQPSIGTTVHDYNTSANLAKNNTHNHDYVVTSGKILTLEQVQGATSGRFKAELMIETGVATGVFNTKAVWFKSVSNPDFDCTFARPLTVAAGVRVRIAITNDDQQPMDVYSFINGFEV